MKKYNPTYCFKDTESEAKQFCKSIDIAHNRYIRKKHPSTYSGWVSTDGNYKGFLVVYWH